MKELSVFVDESGDWGEYDFHSPFYIISFVLHDQNVNIAPDLNKLNDELLNVGYPGHCFHAGPIIRGEEEYKRIDMASRQKFFKKMMGFVRRMDIRYKAFYIEKKQFDNSLDAVGRLSKQLSIFLQDHLDYFLSYDVVKVYYDNGQVEVNKILSSVLNAILDNVKFKKVLPKDYRLFQVADFICTMKLVQLKMDRSLLSRSEKSFFESERTLKKKYLKPILSKEMGRFTP